MPFHTVDQVTHQCAWCSQMQDGEEPGVLRLSIDAHGTLQFEAQPDVSHICCALCYTRERLDRMRSRSVPTTLTYFNAV